MANVYAVKTGNWSDPTVWNTGALPTSADDVYANNFTVTIDISPTVLSVRNGATTGVTAGGSFVPTDGITLRVTGAGVVAGTTSNTNCFASSLATGQNCTIIGNVAGGTGGNISPIAANNLSSGTLNIIGNCSAGSANNAIAAYNSGTGTIIITGSVIGGSSSFGICVGALNSSTGTVDITGSVIGGSAQIGALNSSTGTLKITGSVNGSSAAGVANNSSGNLTIEGPVNAAAAQVAISGGSINQNTFLTGPFIGTAQGVSANVAVRWRWIPSVGSSYMTVPNSTATGYKNLYTADSTDGQSGQPATTNVRSGTVYGPSNELTGTCAVPAAGSVALGVPVDATTGTAVLTAETVRSAVGLASANLDVQFDTLPTAAEIAQAVWEYTTRALSDVSAIVSGVWAAATRTVTGGTIDSVANLDAPTEAEIAAAVRTELATELGRIDVATSTRLAPDGTLARVTLTDTTTAVTDTAAIADAVRTELTPELARVANTATTQEVADIVEGAGTLP